MPWKPTRAGILLTTVPTLLDDGLYRVFGFSAKTGRWLFTSEPMTKKACGQRIKSLRAQHESQ